MPETNPYFPDYAGLRAWRLGHYANWDPGVAPRRRRAVLTMVRDEAEQLPIWLGYYSQFFAPGDIYVLDHDTRDGSTSGPGFNRIPVSHPSFDMAWQLEQLSDMEAQLLERYDVVVVCDVDEIIAPDPASPTPDLGVYLDRMDEEFVNCVGYEVLHQPDTEPPLDPGRPLLAQRSMWFPSPLYNKPAVTTSPIQRVEGLHRRADGVNNFDPDLRLIHLHRLDVERCFQRHLGRAGLEHAESDLMSGLNSHNRIRDRGEFDRWFHTSVGLEGVPLVCEPIEPRWHTVV